MTKLSSSKNLPTNVTTVGGIPIEMPVSGYKLGRRATSPLISLTHNHKIAFRPEGEIVTGREDTKAKGMDKPMTVVPVIDLATGESVTLIVPTVLESALRRIPGGYVGKNLLAVQGPKMPGKRYFQIELFELEADATQKGA